MTSFTTHNRSNLDKIGSVNSTLSAKFLVLSYLPFYGFAAAITLHLACKDVTIPAFEIEILCCSIAS